VMASSGIVFRMLQSLRIAPASFKTPVRLFLPKLCLPPPHNKLLVSGSRHLGNMSAEGSPGGGALKKARRSDSIAAAKAAAAAAAAAAVRAAATSGDTLAGPGTAADGDKPASEATGESAATPSSARPRPGPADSVTPVDSGSRPRPAASGRPPVPPLAEGGRVIGFYGHSEGREYREFSNFYWMSRKFRFRVPEFALQDQSDRDIPRVVECQTSEKAIMLTKAALMKDPATFKLMMGTEKAAEVKALGRKVKNFDNKKWTERVEEVAFECVRQKFESDPDLVKVLLSTGDSTIAEATRNDKIWGIGIDVGDPRIQDRKKWLGTNILGFALMRVRDHLRAKVKGSEPAAEKRALR